MGRRKVMTESALSKRLRAGYGSGDGKSYKPLVEVQCFSSKGVQTRVYDEENDRIVHVHSNGERTLYHALKYFIPGLFEYKEQYPMERRVTLGAARQLGIRHPVHPGTGVPVMMTLDALTKHRKSDGTAVTTGWDVKPHADLQRPRVLEKLSLHRAYCNWAGISHRVVTERSFPRHLVHNLEWLRAGRLKAGELELPGGGLAHLSQRMLEELASGRHQGTLSIYGRSFDMRHALPPGTGMRVLKYLWWNRWLSLDILANPVEEQELPSRSSVLVGDALAALGSPQ